LKDNTSNPKGGIVMSTAKGYSPSTSGSNAPPQRRTETSNPERLPTVTEPELPAIALTPRSVMTKCADLDQELKAFEKACFPEACYVDRHYYLHVDVAHGRKVLANLAVLRERFAVVHRPTEPHELAIAVARLVTSCNRQSHIRLGTLTDSYLRILSALKPVPTVFGLARATDSCVEQGIWLPDAKLPKLVRYYTRRGEDYAALLEDEEDLARRLREAEQEQLEYRREAKQREKEVRQKIETLREEWGFLPMGLMPLGWEKVMSEEDVWATYELDRVDTEGGDDDR
jgi:hypothetical protein